MTTPEFNVRKNRARRTDAALSFLQVGFQFLMVDFDDAVRYYHQTRHFL
jgi:hypothetical protein